MVIDLDRFDSPGVGGFSDLAHASLGEDYNTRYLEAAAGRAGTGAAEHQQHNDRL